jgi:hypothetical protein
MKTATANIRFGEALRASIPATMSQPHITEAERKQRREAVDYARASVALEGFALSDEDKIQEERFVNGEIDLDELLSQ